MSTRGIKKWALLLTFWLALHTASLRAQTVLYSGTSPAVLQMEGTSGILEAIGTQGTGTLSLSGAGTRMVWYPGKSAFRAGTVSGTGWDNANIGSYSVAFGNNTKATGIASAAFGGNTTASAYGSTAFGWLSTASGYYSATLGGDNTASGYASMAFGFVNTASGRFSTASGGYNVASGIFSTASGNHTTASAYNSFVLGRYNTGGGTTNSWVTTEALFEVGNGTSGTHSDALLLDKSGNLTVNTVKASKFISPNATSSSGTDAVAFGNNTSATGSYSMAVGGNSTASGLGSTAFGIETLASGEVSTANGWQTTASAYASAAFGYNTTASSSEATAFGYTTTASGFGSTTFGFITAASGSFSTASGYRTTAASYVDFVTGRWNVGGGTANSWISTEPLFEIGNGTSSTSKSDALLLDKSGNLTVSSVQANSFHTSASAYDSFVVGRYNTGGGATSSWVSADPLFEVGNGTTSTSKSDALLVDKSGNVTAKTFVVTAPGGDIPMFSGY